MSEVEEELHGLREECGAARQDLVNGGTRLKERVSGHDGVRREHEPAPPCSPTSTQQKQSRGREQRGGEGNSVPERVEAEPGRGGDGGGNDDGGQGEAEGDDADQQNEEVQAAAAAAVMEFCERRRGGVGVAAASTSAAASATAVVEWGSHAASLPSTGKYNRMIDWRTRKWRNQLMVGSADVELCRLGNWWNHENEGEKHHGWRNMINGHGHSLTVAPLPLGPFTLWWSRSVSPLAFCIKFWAFGFPQLTLFACSISNYMCHTIRAKTSKKDDNIYLEYQFYDIKKIYFMILKKNNHQQLMLEE